MLSNNAATLAIQLCQFIISKLVLTTITADLILHATVTASKTIFCSTRRC